MKTYTYDYPHKDGYAVTVVRNEDQIIEEYWDYWYDRMVKAGKKSQCTRQNCIDDWVIVNWASEVTSKGV